MSVRRAYTVAGTVQGVGFRWFTRQAATDLGLRGTVRNAPDGTVRVEVEGPADRVAAFEDRLRAGPPAARVERVDERPAARTPLPPGFTIER